MKPTHMNIQPKASEVGRENHQWAKVRMSMISDDVLALSHLVGDGKFDIAAQRLLTLTRNCDVLAGYLSRLVEPLLELRECKCKLP